MNVLLTGASGLIGSALVRALADGGHRVVRLSRSPTPASTGSATWNPAAGQIDLSQAGSLEAVIHLAGEPIGRRWTADRKLRMRQSRVAGTRVVSEAVARLPQVPRVLVCASGTGFYGDRGVEWLDEASSPGAGFLADLTREWEAAAAPALHAGTRVVHLRFGIVLAAHGGALAKMLPAFNLGLAGKLGNGRQYWSWIALEDVVRVIRHALDCEVLAGPVNAVTPNPVTNEEFTKTVGGILRRPTIFGMPRFAVEWLFGELGREALLVSFRVKPAKLIDSGFAFRWPELEPALRQMLGKPN